MNQHTSSSAHKYSLSVDAQVGKGSSIGPFAVIHGKAIIGANCQIGAGVVIADKVTIGDDCIIKAKSVIESKVIIGSRVIIHSGSIIGGEGFGYVQVADGNKQIPHLGNIIIEDDVEIGCNSMVDRGALFDTRIGQGTKIGSQSYISHNHKIGKRCQVGNCVGMGGSVTLEDDCIVGSRCSFGNNIKLAKASVMHDYSILSSDYRSEPKADMANYAQLDYRAVFRSLEKLISSHSRIK